MRFANPPPFFSHRGRAASATTPPGHLTVSVVAFKVRKFSKHDACFVLPPIVVIVALFFYRTPVLSIHPSHTHDMPCNTQGQRSYMEDDYFISKDGRFAGVYDGHGGAAVSKYLKQNLQAQVHVSLSVCCMLFLEGGMCV